jgi:hypothetical protein
MRGLHATAVHHIPALSPVQTPFPKLAEPETTQSIKDKSRERRESKGGHTGRALLALGQLLQPLNKECIKIFVAVASSNLDVALKDTNIRQIILRTPPGEG